MLTTVALDGDLARLLEHRAREQGVTLKDAGNCARVRGR
jgi:hypothetical protein